MEQAGPKPGNAHCTTLPICIPIAITECLDHLLPIALAECARVGKQQAAIEALGETCALPERLGRHQAPPISSGPYNTRLVWARWTSRSRRSASARATRKPRSLKR